MTTYERARITAVMAVVALVPGLNGSGVLEAAAEPGGYRTALGDDQGSHLGRGDVPTIPGLAWVAELPGREFNGTHNGNGNQGFQRPTVVDQLGHVLVQTDNTTQPAAHRNELTAIDTTTGEIAWTASGISDDCPVGVGPDGRIWGLHLDEDVHTNVRTLVSIDPATGAMTDQFTGPANDTAAEPVLSACDEAPLRFSSDGSKLLVLGNHAGTFGGLHLRVLDVSGSTTTQDSVIRIGDFYRSGSEYGPVGTWDEMMRVAPSGSPGEGSVYLIQRTPGDTGLPDDDTTTIRAIDIDSLPAHGEIGDVIDRSVELPVTQSWAGGVTVVDDAIYLSGEEALEGRIPTDGNNVDGRTFRVVDNGTTLEETARAVGRRDDSTREPGEHNWHFNHLTAGDGATLVGQSRTGEPAGIDAVTLQQKWSHDGFDCGNASVAAGAAGAMVFDDFCEEALFAVAPDGDFMWDLPYDDRPETPRVDEGVHDFVDGSGEYDLGTLGGFSVDAVTDDGTVIVSAQTGSDASFSGVAVFGITQGIAPDFLPLVPGRVLETRSDVPDTTVPGGLYGVGRVGAGERIEVPVAGLAGVPADAEAASLNVTVVDAVGPGFATVWPCDEARPDASNLNYSAGGAFPNAVLSKLSAAGSVCVYTRAAADVLVDVNGAFPAGSRYMPLVPGRVLETRSDVPDSTVPGGRYGVGRVGAGERIVVPVAGLAGVPSGAAAVSLNVTVVDAAGPGFATVWPCDEARPDASNLNYSAGGAFPNAVLSKLSAAGSVCVYTLAAADIIVDVNGAFPAESDYLPLVPGRLLETRSDVPDSTVSGGQHGVGRVGPEGSIEVPVAGLAGVPIGASSVSLNVTVVDADGPGFATVWPCDEDRPAASNLNYSEGGAFPNAALSKLSADGSVCVYTLAEADIIVDVNGAFTR